jgi:chromate transporter
VAGACFATLGVITPSVIICLLIAKFFLDFLKYRGVRGVLYGVRPVVVGLIAYAAWTAGIDAIYRANSGLPLDIDWAMAVLAAIVLILMKIKKLKLDPILLILASGITGILLYAIGI